MTRITQHRRKSRINLASKLYDAIAQRFSSIEYYSEIKEIVDTVGDVSGKKILEIGAGTCKVSAYWKNRYPSCSIVAADISKSHLQLGATKADIETIHSPTEQLPEALTSRGIHHAFDIVVGVDTIHHHWNRVLALCNCYALLRPGGVLVLRDVSRLLSGFIRYKVIDKLDFLLSSMQGLKYLSPAYFSAEELEVLLRHIGFQHVQIERLRRSMIRIEAQK